MKRSRANALMVNHDPTLRVQRDRVLDLVKKGGLAAIYVETGWVPDGGLMSYAPTCLIRTAAAHTLLTGF
jgi:hypothetical protein